MVVSCSARVASDRSLLGGNRGLSWTELCILLAELWNSIDRCKIGCSVQWVHLIVQVSFVVAFGNWAVAVLSGRRLNLVSYRVRGVGFSS